MHHISLVINIYHLVVHGGGFYFCLHIFECYWCAQPTGQAQIVSMVWKSTKRQACTICKHPIWKIIKYKFIYASRGRFISYQPSCTPSWRMFSKPGVKRQQVGRFVGLIKGILNKAWLKNIINWLSQFVAIAKLGITLLRNNWNWMLILMLVSPNICANFMIWLTVYSLWSFAIRGEIKAKSFP